MKPPPVNEKATVENVQMMRNASGEDPLTADAQLTSSRATLSIATLRRQSQSEGRDRVGRSLFEPLTTIRHIWGHGRLTGSNHIID